MGKIVFRGFTDEFFQPLAHLFATPTNHSSVIYTQSAIGDDKVFVYSDYLAEAFAIGAGTNGGVERKHLVVGFLKGNTVCFKLRAEGKKVVCCRPMNKSGACRLRQPSYMAVSAESVSRLMLSLLSSAVIRSISK